MNYKIKILTIIFGILACKKNSDCYGRTTCKNKRCSGKSILPWEGYIHYISVELIMNF